MLQFVCRETCRQSLPLVAALAASLALACASAPAAAPGTGTVWGYVKLVPREGVTPGGGGGGAYADRALRDVQFVDYTRPGFAVVYVATNHPSAQTARIAIRRSSSRLRLEPGQATAATGGSVTVVNETQETHTVSDPTAGVISQLGPGEEVRIAHPAVGSHPIRLLGAPRVRAEVFVAPGAHDRVSELGRYEIVDLVPGDVEIRTWHSRFPPTVRKIRIPAGGAVRLDLPVGVSLEPDGTSQ